ncbi:hypothetical protein [Agriterribacter sp.]|uniref:hypothetical protein n=1 Tax=Agriterribacter sp. TaxID=2821509 RepID=UPI002CF8D9CE|nr:hypothetical protein [Agriterribacter sp.]HRP55443.1 hypothetical protein [Agriterribacter sp.]
MLHVGSGDLPTGQAGTAHGGPPWLVSPPASDSLGCTPWLTACSMKINNDGKTRTLFVECIHESRNIHKLLRHWVDAGYTPLQ